MGDFHQGGAYATGDAQTAHPEDNAATRTAHPDEQAPQEQVPPTLHRPAHRDLQTGAPDLKDDKEH